MRQQAGIYLQIRTYSHPTSNKCKALLEFCLQRNFPGQKNWCHVSLSLLSASAHIQSNYLDLVEEWSDFTELPFVHGVWTERANALTDEEAELLIKAGKRGVEKVRENEKREQTGEQPFSFLLDEENIASLGEFFRLAYYHGILPDIPDLNFRDNAPSGSASVPSLN